MSSLTCENCGSVSFSLHEDGYYVCDDCQVQSQDYIAEEQEFEDAGGANSSGRFHAAHAVQSAPCIIWRHSQARRDAESGEVT